MCNINYIIQYPWVPTGMGCRWAWFLSIRRPGTRIRSGAWRRKTARAPSLTMTAKQVEGSTAGFGFSSFSENGQRVSGWWFGTCFIFPYIGNNDPNWLSYFSEGFKPPTRCGLSFFEIYSCFLSNPGWWYQGALTFSPGRKQTVGGVWKFQVERFWGQRAEPPSHRRFSMTGRFRITA